ncbi:O-antigen ligase family protein [Candidatus Laterigemmans baculatus]|uniref:O-antigen ligase family protein n=1 Tax=Candidatus Laterigemmans baculatus TaxID=2770505 RepID=UPI0013DA449D|nr:O-antigen ligase family protein [Candidatus Laterigemmans baculatus]
MSPLVPLFSLAAAVWLVHLLRHGTVPLFGLVVLVAGTVFGPSFFAIDGPFQISLDRVLWVCLIAFFIVQRRLGETDPKRFSRADWLLLALVAVTAVSSQRSGTVPDGSSPLARWIFYIFLPAGMYAIARSATLRSSDLRLVSSGLIGLGVYLGIVAVLETSGAHALVFPRYIVDPEIWEFLGRARGPLLNPTGNGIVLTVALGAAVMRWLEPGRIGKLGYGAAVLVILAGCGATLTRCVWLGAILLLGLIALHYAPRWLRVWSLAATVLVAGGMGMLYKDQLLRIKRDEHLSASAAEESIQLRPLLAVIAWEMFQDRPLLGHGYGHYFAHNQAYTQIRDWELPLQTAGPYMQHNIFLSLLVDCGLIGLALLVGLLAWWTACGWSLYRNTTIDPEARRLGMVMVAMTVGYLASGMFQDVTVIPMVHMYLMFIAGLTMGVHSRGGVVAKSASAAELPERRTQSLALST